MSRQYEEMSDLRIILADSPEDPKADDVDCSRCNDCKYCFLSDRDVAFCSINKWFIYDEAIDRTDCGDEACADFEEGYTIY